MKIVFLGLFHILGDGFSREKSQRELEVLDLGLVTFEGDVRPCYN